MKDEEKLNKNDVMVQKLKDWVDEMYSDGRTTSLSNSEIEIKIKELTGGKEFVK